MPAAGRTGAARTRDAGRRAAPPRTRDQASPPRATPSRTAPARKRPPPRARPAAARAAAPRGASLADLARATLARQMLLERRQVPVAAALARHVAFQAQLARPPFIGLAARVAGFRPAALLGLLRGRAAVRATSLRGTLHVMAAGDFLAMRAALQPGLTHAARSMVRTRLRPGDAERALETARACFAAGPRTFEALREELAARHPRGDVRAMAYWARLHLPLVMVPGEERWGYPPAAEFALAESWLGRPPVEDAAVTPLALRYLAAFGPATAADFQSWSGVPGTEARAAFAELRDRLVEVRDERGRLLHDLPDAPRPAAGTPPPPRLLPEFDHLVLAHADRRRFVADEHRRRVYLPGLRVAPTVLAGGGVAGTWSLERRDGRATVEIAPFAALRRADREALAAEAEAVVSVVEEGARPAVAFARPAP